MFGNFNYLKFETILKSNKDSQGKMGDDNIKWSRDSWEENGRWKYKIKLEIARGKMGDNNIELSRDS